MQEKRVSVTDSLIDRNQKFRKPPLLKELPYSNRYVRSTTLRTKERTRTYAPRIRSTEYYKTIKFPTNIVRTGHRSSKLPRFRFQMMFSRKGKVIKDRTKDSAIKVEYMSSRALLTYFHSLRHLLRYVTIPTFCSWFGGCCQLLHIHIR